MSSPRLEKFLHEHQVAFRTQPHAAAFTAQEIAASAHVRGKDLAKPVMVELDDRLVMVVLPANERLHLGRLREATGAREARLAIESEFKDRFPECELGAMPPFGNLYGLDTIVSDSLAEDDEIAFNAGSHTELMHMAYLDFVRLAHPKVMDLRRH